MLGFELERVMRTPYRIDDFQQVYFVTASLETLLAATLQDFQTIYSRLDDAPDIPIGAILPEDEVIWSEGWTFVCRAQLVFSVVFTPADRDLGIALGAEFGDQGQVFFHHSSSATSPVLRGCRTSVPDRSGR